MLDKKDDKEAISGSEAIKEARWWQDFSAPVALGSNVVKEVSMPNDIYMGAYKHINDYQ